MRVATFQTAPTGVVQRRVHWGRRPLSLLSILALSAGLVACGDGGSGSAAARKVELTIAWWGGPERADLTDKALALYTQKHPNVTFKKHSDVWKDYYPKLDTMTARGETLDVLQTDDNALAEYTKRNIALDLSTYVASKKIDESRFPESLAKGGNVNGKPYAVASAENSPAMIYDRTVVRQYGMAEPQIGWSYDQLIAWAAELATKGGGTVAGTMDGAASHQALWMWLRAQGKEMYNGSQLGFGAEDVQRWFELWAGARRLKATPSTEVIHQANSGDVTKQPILTRQAVTAFAWSNQFTELQKGTDHELGITAFPGDPKGAWARASMFWSIYQSSKHPAEAADVINFLINDPGAGKILGTERGLPANLDIRDQLAGSLSAVMQATVKYEGDMVPRFGPAPAPPPKGHGETKTLLIQAAENVMYGRATAQQAAAQFVTQAQQALSG
jgi:multiple sugar transport system substrate-binding protein